MQLEDRRSQFALAVCALLGGGAAHAQAAGTPPADQAAVIDSGFLWYQESGQRITDAEAVVAVRQPLADDRAWNAHLTIDSVCGGSPIGALPSKQSQHFVTPTATSLNPPVTTQTTTSASGGGGDGNVSLCSNPVQNQQYDVAPGQLPIDQSFHDQRIALAGGFETPLDRLDKLSVGAAFSHETDFQSGSVNASLARDFNQRNTTVSLGVNLESDSIRPVGGTPVPLSTYGSFEKGGDRSRRVQDVLLSATQVVTRRWLTQVNLSGERSNGYQTDPYKIVSELDAQGNNAAGQYVYESRPDARNRLALFWDNKYAFDQDMLEASFRHTRDSWGLRTDTFETRYRWNLGSLGYLEPHWRGYRQTAADFFHFYLPQGGTLPDYASADPRLAAFRGQTLGLKFGVPVGAAGEFSFRAERYRQTGSGQASPLPGLQGLDLYPGMQAWILQLGLRGTF